MTSASSQFDSAPGVAIGDANVFDLRHLDHPWRPVFVAFIAGLVTVAVMAGLTYHIYGDAFSDTALSIYCWLYAGVTLMWLASKVFRPGPRNWLSPDGIFWLVFTMFHLPFVVLYLVGLADFTRDVFHSPDTMNRAVYCVLLAGIAFLIGYELGPVGRQQPARFAPVPRVPALQFNVAQALFAAAFVLALAAVALGLGRFILTHGYGGFRRIERYVGPEAKRWISLALLMLRIAATLYIASCIVHHRKIFKGVLVPGLLILGIGFFLVLGGRSSAATLLIPLLIGRHYFVKPIRLRWGVPLLLGLVVLFGVIGIGRRAESLSPSEVLRAYREYRQETGINPFVASLAETGASVRTVNVTCAYIPTTEPYWLGKSIWNAALMIIPSPIKGLREELAPSAWVTLKATGRVGGETAGWGSSIAMEAYMNFGLYGGALFMMTIGFMMRRIYDTTLRRPTFLRIVLMLITVTSLALWCRNYSHHFFRPVAWTMIAAWLLWSPFGRRAVSAPSALTPQWPSRR